jgi:hypothetical protein
MISILTCAYVISIQTPQADEDDDDTESEEEDLYQSDLDRMKGKVAKKPARGKLIAVVLSLGGATEENPMTLSEISGAHTFDRNET